MCCCCLCAGLRVSSVAVAVVVATLMPGALIGVHSFVVVGAGALPCWWVLCSSVLFCGVRVCAGEVSSQD